MIAPAKKSRPKLSPEGRKAQLAMRRAVALASEQSRRAHIPLAIWQNGRVTLIRP